MDGNWNPCAKFAQQPCFKFLSLTIFAWPCASGSVAMYSLFFQWSLMCKLNMHNWQSWCPTDTQLLQTLQNYIPLEIFAVTWHVKFCAKEKVYSRASLLWLLTLHVLVTVFMHIKLSHPTSPSIAVQPKILDPNGRPHIIKIHNQNLIHTLSN
jgi:hypothetical protein